MPYIYRHIYVYIFVYIYIYIVALRAKPPPCLLELAHLFREHVVFVSRVRSCRSCLFSFPRHWYVSLIKSRMSTSQNLLISMVFGGSGNYRGGCPDSPNNPTKIASSMAVSIYGCPFVFMFAFSVLLFYFWCLSRCLSSYIFHMFSRDDFCAFVRVCVDAVHVHVHQSLLD